MHASDPSGLLAILPISDRAKADLVRRMNAPDRHYHTMAHLELLWERHQRYAIRDLRSSRCDALVALAIAFHDSVFVSGRADNEARSAKHWLSVAATATNVAEEDRLWIADTICATADHLAAAHAIDLADPRGYARQWVLDLDLTPLGECAVIFDRNMDLLCAECPDLPLSTRRENIKAAIRHFAAAAQLYHCAPLAAAFEPQARMNFSRHNGADRVSIATDRAAHRKN